MGTEKEKLKPKVIKQFKLNYTTWLQNPNSFTSLHYKINPSVKNISILAKWQCSTNVY